MGPLLVFRFLHELWASLDALPPPLTDPVDSSRNKP